MLAYLYGITVTAESVEQHNVKLREAFEKFNKAQLFMTKASTAVVSSIITCLGIGPCQEGISIIGGFFRESSEGRAEHLNVSTTPEAKLLFRYGPILKQVILLKLSYQ